MLRRFILSQSMNGFVDFENSISNFIDDEFIALLDDWKRVFYGRGVLSYQDSIRNLNLVRAMSSMQNFSVYATRYAFSIEDQLLSPINALFPNSNPYFINYIPITDEQGRLRQAHPMFRVGGSQGIPIIFGAGHLAVSMISASADSTVTWEYMRHLAAAFVTVQQPHMESSPCRADTFSTHIMRDFATDHMLELHTSSRLSHQWCRSRPHFDTVEERMELIDIAMARLERYNEMPVTSPFFLPSGLFMDTLDTFLRSPDGFMGATQTAQELHNRASLWLIEP